jgi:hypothetical protein
MPVRKVVNEQGVVIEKIFNPSVGKYDVMVTTGPSYMTKRQESMEAMSQILQGNPQLWAVAGDLFVKNMDWPGAQEMAKRLAKTIDPKLLQEDGENPALEMANQQMQAMAAELDNLHNMLKNVQQSMEARELAIKEFDSQVKAFQAETQRIAAVQDSMTPEQISDIVQGTIAAALDTGDLVGGMPQMEMPEMESEMMPQPVEAPPNVM